MNKLNIPFFYTLGVSLGKITGITDWSKTSFVDFIVALASANAQYKVLFEQFPGLRVCKQAGEDFSTSTEAFFGRMNELDELKNAEWSSPVSAIGPSAQFSFNNLWQKAKNFETVLIAELQTLDAYQVTQTGIYSVPHLIENADDAFPMSIKTKLSAEVLFEIRESGKCLAFGLPTGCAFHALRATESVIHSYYLKACKPAKKDKLGNWGAYIAEFRKSRNADVKRVAELIQQLKDHDRNLIMHPEIVLIQDDAHTLFELVQGVIMAMAGKL